MASAVSLSFSFLSVLVQRGEVPQITAEQFLFRIERLVQRFKLHTHDAEELGQELLLAVVHAKASHRGDGAPFERYLKAVLNRAYCDVCRRLRKECGKRNRTEPLEDAVDQHSAMDTLMRDDAVRRAAISATNLANSIVFDLSRMSRADAARLRGVHRGTVLRQAASLRPLFKDAIEKI